MDMAGLVKNILTVNERLRDHSEEEQDDEQD